MPTRFRNAERLFRALGLPLLATALLIFAGVVFWHEGQEEKRSAAMLLELKRIGNLGLPRGDTGNGFQPPMEQPKEKP